MAEQIPIGRALLVSDDVLRRLDEADKKINKIASDSEKMAANFSSAMTKMSGDTGNLLEKLQKINTIMGSLGNIKSSGVETLSSGLGKVATDAEKAAENITKVAGAVNKTNSLSSSQLDVANWVTKQKEAQEKAEKELASLSEKYAKEEQQRVEVIAKAEDGRRKAKRSFYEESLKYAEQLDKKEEAAANKRIKEEEALAKSQAKMDSRLRRSNYSSYVTSTEGSLRTADKASTYEQRAQAIKNLEAAIKKLNSTDANYQKNLNTLSAAHKKLTAEQKTVEANFRSIESSQSRLMNTSDQLARKFALIFSVSQISNFMQQIVKVTGEFELQNTALASILQNKEQADTLFAQIKELAIQSPFTLKELTTYTKSLSAYSVEYKDLYNTTKMLADVSAGLGVDMERLILAFGQVKAANFLRGTETRQFTEAGINMLGELSKYYSELEGRIVSVSEVQDRQFKKMISFEDVAEVFKRLTSEGGMFYKMQETQADTLAGMMSNLKDKIDLMLNSIGQDQESTIKKVIGIIGSLIENYEVMGNVIKAAGAAFVSYKVYLLLTNKELITFALRAGIATQAATKQLTVMQLLNVGVLKLAKGIKTLGTSVKDFAAKNPWLIALVAVSTAIYEAIHWNDEYNEKMDEVTKRSNETSKALNKIAYAYDNIAKNAKKSASGEYDTDTYKDLYAQLSELDQKLKDKGYTLPIQMEFVTPENIDEAFNKALDTAKLANEFATEFSESLNKELTATEMWGIVGDNLETDLKQLSDSYGEVGAEFNSQLDEIELNLDELSGKFSESARKYYDELKAGKKDQETDYEWTMRRLDLVNKINHAMSDVSTGGYYNVRLKNESQLNSLLSKRKEILDNEKEAGYELNKVFDDIIKKYGGLDNLKKKFNENPLVIKTEIDRAFEQLELNEQAKRFASFWASQKLQIPVEFTTPSQLPQFFNDFRDTAKTLDTTGVLKNELGSIQNLLDMQSVLQKKYRENQEYLNVLNKANTNSLNLTKQISDAKARSLSADASKANAAKLELQNLQKQKQVIDSNTASEKKRVQAQQENIKAIAAAYNLSYQQEKKTGRSSKTNEALNRLKEQISLIQKAGDKYQNLLDTFNKSDATEQVKNAFRDAFQNVGLSIDMDFDTEGIIKKIESLPYAAIKGGKQAADEALADLKSKLYIDIRTKGVDNVQKQMEDIFSGYELSVELDKIGLDKPLAEQLFGIDTFSLDDVQKKLDDTFIELANKQEKILAESEGRKVNIYTDTQKAVESLGEKGLSAYKDLQSKITDAQNKEVQERIKKYAEYLKSSVTERVAIELEAQKKIAEVQATSEFTPTQKETITKKIRVEADKKLDEQSWKDFQQSDFYVKMFEDMDAVSTKVLDAMLFKLDKLRSSLTNLSPEDLKEITTQMEKIRDMKIQRDPFTGFIGNLKDYIKYQKEASELNDKYLDAVGLKDIYEKAIEKQELLVDAERQKYSAAIDKYGVDSKDAMLAKANLGYQEDALDTLLKQLVAQKKITKELAEQIRKGEASVNNLSKRLSEWSQLFSTLSSSVTEIAGGIENIFGTMSDKGADAVSTLTDSLDGLSGMFDGLSNLALNMGTNPLAAVTGGIQALGGLFKTIGSLFNIGDKKKEREIQRQLELVENLQKAYEKLEEAIEDAYSIDTLKSTTDQSIENLKQQNEALEKAIAAEEAKKTIDSDKIKEYQDQIEENNEQMEELIKEQFSKVTGGILDDILSAAEEFTDAWLESFKEVGDGMDGLEEDFQDMLESMLKRQAAMLITQTYLDDWKKQLEQYVNADDLELTADEAKKWVTSVTNSLPQLNEALENYVNAMKEAGFDLTDDSGDTMSGLQKGISSLSEQTAEALEALLSSMRFYVADTNTDIKSIYNFLINTPAESPLMQELKAQTEQLRIMSDLWRSLTMTKSGVSGKCLRVNIV